MPRELTYLIIDLGAIAVPLLFSFHPKISFYKQWSAFWPANLLVAAVFVVWDALYTQAGIWGFNDTYILGPRLFALPLEELLFFVCIPYSSVFTYHCFRIFFPTLFSKITLPFSRVLSLVLLIVALLNASRLYTSVTFVALAITILLLVYSGNKTWLNTFYLMFVVILVPFFVVNGLLTGTGLEKPIVWYDDSENLGIRLLTIPVEDIFYGMLLLLLNVFFFEKIKGSFN
jgi:lycopene cyclase domain-containing protein